MHTLATQFSKKKKKVQKQEVCSRLLTPSLYPPPLWLKKKHGRRRGKWEDELGPLFVSPNTSGFLCRVIYLSMVDGVLISGH